MADVRGWWRVVQGSRFKVQGNLALRFTFHVSRLTLWLVSGLGVVLLWVGVVGSEASGGISQGATLGRTQQQPPPLTVISQEATPDFPDSITFSLTASGFAASRATLQYRLVGRPVTAQLEVDRVGVTTTIDLQVTLDLASVTIPPGAEVEYYWSLADGAGRRVDTPADTFTLMDTRFRWEGRGVDDRRLTVFSYGRDEAFNTFLNNTAQAALVRLEGDLGARLDRQVSIWVYASEDDLLGANPQGVPDWISGQAFPELGLALVAIPDGEEARNEIKRIVPHELAHIVLHHITRNPYNTPPAWLNEGLAVYNEETPDPTHDELLRQAAERGEIGPLRAISSSFGPDEETAALAYAQSRSVVAFVLESDKYGPGKLALTLAAFREGVTHDEALQRGLGVSTDELDAEWRASLPYEIAAAPIENPPTAPQESSPLPLIALGAALGLTLAALVAVVAVLLVRRNVKRE